MKRVEQLLSLLPHGMLVEAGYANSFFLQLNALETQADLRDWIEENQRKNASAIVATDASGNIEYRGMEQEVEPGSIFLMQLNGPVIPESKWGLPGLDLLEAQLDWATRNENIAGTVLLMETGGGSVYKLWSFCDAMRAMREKKPIVGLSRGMNASAGIAINSCTTESFAEHSSTRIGSIGVCMSHIDIKPMMEEAGCKHYYHNSSLSPDKNKEILELEDGKPEAMIADLDEIAKEFHARVQAERKNISQAAMTGKMYNAPAAIELDIIDGLASLEQAISRAYSLSQIKTETV